MLTRVSREQGRAAHQAALGHILIYCSSSPPSSCLCTGSRPGLSYIDEHNIPLSGHTQKEYEQIMPSLQESWSVIVEYEPRLAEELNAQARTQLRS